MTERLGRWSAMGAALLNSLQFTGADDLLSGTKHGPTGWYLTTRERQALRKRVQSEPWAQEYFRQRIVPSADRGDPVSAGLAYAITGERRYAQQARDRLLYGVNWWEARPKDFSLEKPAYSNWRGGNSAWGVDSSLVGGVDMATLHDLVADTLSPEEDAAIRGTIRVLVDYSCNWMRQHGGNPNMNFIAFTSFYQWAASVGYGKGMDWVLNHVKPDTNHGGMLQMLDEYMRDGEISTESPIYQTISLRVFDLAACAYRYEGRDLFQYRSPKGNTLKGVLDGLINTAWPLMRTGVYGGTICPANWGHGGTTYLGEIAVVNRPSDTWTSYSCEAAIATMLRVYPQDKTYRYLMSLTGRATKKGTTELAGEPALDDLLHGRLPITDDEPGVPARSRLYPTGGVAMLRFPETSGYWQRGIAAWLHGGELSRGHLADPSLMFFGAGRLLFPQFLVAQYEDPAVTGWCMRRISRNTITIDGKDGLYSYSTYRHSFDPEVKFVSVRCHPYLEAEMERALMLTGEYLLDVFRAKVLPEAVSEEDFPGVGGSVYWYYNASLSEDVIVHPGQERNFYGTSREKVYGPRKMPASHTFDYTLHALGRQFPDAWNLYQPSKEFALSYWPDRWVQRERKRETDESFYLDWIQASANHAPDLGGGEHRGWDKLGEVWFKDRAGVRTRMLGEPGTKVFLGEGPMRWGPVDSDLTPEEVIPFLAVRRVGRETLYVALHEPYKDKPVIREFRYLHKPAEGETQPAVGVMVAGPDYVDRLFVTLGLRDGEGREDTKSARRPLTTVTAHDDQGEGIAYRGHAYLRVQGPRLVARGDIEAFSLYAPEVRTVILNGKDTSFARRRGHVLFGQNRWKQGREPQHRTQKALWVPPLSMSLPQQYVNIDVGTGGELVVRVQNVARPDVRGSASAGRVEVMAEAPMVVTPTARAVSPLAPRQRQDLSFRLSGGQFGQRLRLKARLLVGAEGGQRFAQEIVTDVSVGVTVQEIAQSYTDRVDHNRFQTDLYDRFLVRAPGYTIEVDRFSGTSRSMIDPEGHERMAAAAYPLQFSRGNPTFALEDHPYEIPCAKKSLDWRVEAKLLRQAPDPKTGYPTMTFQTQDGQYELGYLFRPEVVKVAFVPIKEGIPPRTMEFIGLCVEHPTYRYRPYSATGEVGFREGSYSVPKYGQPDRYGGPYYSFRTYPRPQKGEYSLAPRQGNLLVDGGMDEWDPGRQFFKGWSGGWGGDRTATASCTLDSAVRHSGAGSLRYEVTKGLNPTITATAFEAHKGFRYGVSLWMRCDGVQADTVEGWIPRSGYQNSSLQLLWDRPPGAHAWNYFHPAFWPNGTRDWVPVSFSTGAMESNGPVQLQLRLCLGQCRAGTVWVDDVRVEEAQ